MTGPTCVCLLVAAALLLAGAEPLLAHEQAGRATGLLRGFVHPISGLDHIVARIAVGLWGAQLGPPALWRLPVTFPMVMAVIVAMGSAFVVSLRVPWTRIAVRVAGSWVAAIGLLMLGWGLRGVTAAG
jgi:urease accessory protein